MRLRRWHAIPISLMVVAAALVTVAAVIPPEAPPQDGGGGTLSGVTWCTTGSLSLSRFDCSADPTCDDTASESVFLRFGENEVTVRLDRKSWPAPRSEREREQRLQMETPIPRSLLAPLLAEFAALPRRPSDPPRLPGARLRDHFDVFGECDNGYLSGDLDGRRIDLVQTLKAVPLAEFPRVLMLFVRGPGPRAERLFSRIEKLTRQ